MAAARSSSVTGQALRRRAVCFGDSITQYGWASPDGQRGWVAMLADAYQRKVDVTNRGYSGYDTMKGVAILKEALPTPEQQYVFATVFFGANDAAESELQGLTPQQYRTHLSTIVDHCITQAEEFSRIAGEVARGRGAVFLDLASVMRATSSAPEKAYLADGLHLNGALSRSSMTEDLRSWVPHKVLSLTAASKDSSADGTSTTNS
ncbi:uncharacterized protein MONBRDRAFT_8169 [Monosiga brevicollis MX1]|uniref:SGNH hydrolase-type esterase domain-containing protein n=1 Tax=Monosiga brevicollis TaxID=81824 RepID=A9UZ87_MONBE|nr:uncharacterized protein MONBRDRAFT_8169 [Monosiga brevicollis MX1]EDQ89322.1 predicted protein [Monosiga brevicollis MX1]|eukprot:XP_001745898.1 hypothetical protein [Monosiga brevicollis MX1]